jgi:tetratricopeptide (TPR) repeat protein
LTNIEEQIIQFKKEIQEKYSFINIGYEYNKDDDIYDIWHDNDELEFNDSEFQCFSGDLISKLFYDKNITNVFFAYDYDRAKEIELKNQLATIEFDLLSTIDMLNSLPDNIYLTKAHKIVDKRIKGKLDELKFQFSKEFLKIQEATQKMISGYNCQSQGEIDKSIELYTSAVEVFPKIFNGYTSLGYAYLQKQNYASALLSFDKAAELFPDRIESFNDLARVYAVLNNKNDCIKNIKKMVIIDPDSKIFLINDSVVTNIVSVNEINDLYST